MIFSGTSPDGEKHIDKIFKGLKTQTRRKNSTYYVGHTYAVQAKRTAKADPRGRILIRAKWYELRMQGRIIHSDAIKEGGYTPDQYEQLYEAMYPGWNGRWTYEFEVVQCQS